jgi:hypothetical protein
MVTLLAAQLALIAVGAACTGSARAPALDHVVVVVRDLDAAATAFRAAGFRIKPGRLHANNLLNRHIKFRDGSEIELMTVSGPPRDGMAQRYAALLAAGEGGVYVALKVNDIDEAETAAQRAGLATRRSARGMG